MTKHSDALSAYADAVQANPGRTPENLALMKVLADTIPLDPGLYADMAEMMPDCVTTAALADLAATFRSRTHSPSIEQWEALQDLMCHYGESVDGRLKPAVYVSALPPGTGKSSAVQSFARALCANPLYATRGLVIAVQRLDEVADMAEQLEAIRDRMAIVVGVRKQNEVVKLLGDLSDTPENAQVIVTTQSSLRNSLQGGREFNEATRYLFKGRTRTVLWDEALAFNRPVPLSSDRALALCEAVGRASVDGDAANVYRQWAAKLVLEAAGEHEVPIFDGTNWATVEGLVEGQDTLIATAKAVVSLAGRRVSVRKDNTSGAVLLAQYREIPESILPVIVTDASGAPDVGGVRYTQMARKDRPVVYLRTATKTYANLTLSLVHRAASRSTFSDKRQAGRAAELRDLAVSVIRRFAPEPVLVLTFGGRMKMPGLSQFTVKEAVEAVLTDEEKARTSWLTWGNHTASNEHKLTKHVLVLGLNYTTPLMAHAASGAALDLPMHTLDPADNPTEEQVAAMAKAMLRESTVQGLLRGHARMGVDGDCGECIAVVVGHPQSGHSDAEWRSMFPGVKLVDDVANGPMPLKGRLGELASLVERLFAEGAREVSNATMMRALGMSKGNFSTLVKKPEWQRWITSKGIYPGYLKGKQMGLRRVS